MKITHVFSFYCTISTFSSLVKSNVLKQFCHYKNIHTVCGKLQFLNVMANGTCSSFQTFNINKVLLSKFSRFLVTVYYPQVIHLQIKPTRCKYFLVFGIRHSVWVAVRSGGWKSFQPADQQSDKYQCHIDTVSSPDDGHIDV